MNTKRIIAVTLVVVFATATAHAALPAKFRWDNVNGKCYTTPVKAQTGTVNRSYAYAAMDCLETLRLIQKGQDYNALTPSEKAKAAGPVEWAADDAMNGLDTSGYGYDGFPAITKSLNWMLNTGFDDRRVIDLSIGSFFMLDSELVPEDLKELQQNELRDLIIGEIKRRIVNNGPLLSGYQHVEMYANGPYFYYPKCVVTNTRYPNYYATELIVGYDDTIPAGLFNADAGDIPEGNGAWIVKGSYGASYGDNGYYYISYYDHQIFNYTGGLGYDLGYYAYELGVDKNRKYEDFYCHHADTPCGFVSDYDGPSRFSFANMFTAKDDGVVSSVGLFVLSDNASIRFSAYVDCTAGKPMSGTCAVDNDELAFPVAGYHAIRLPHSFTIKKGQRFSVVVRNVSNLGLVYNPNVQAGQSFIAPYDDDFYEYEDPKAKTPYWYDFKDGGWSSYWRGGLLSDPPPNTGFITAYTASDVLSIELSAWDKLQKAKAPYIRGLADPANAGKVTGSGLCAEGKKVTLKATANKGFVFMGWRQGTAVAEAMAVESGNGFVATTPSLVVDRTAKPAGNSATSTTITDVTEDATYYADFIMVDEDRAAVALTLDGVEMRRVEDNAPYQTNVTCGVALEWPVAADALSQTTVKVAGLPAGLKFTAKDIVDSKTKEVTVPANTIYGAPTAASAIDKKTGLPKPSDVKITVATAGKSSVSYLMKFTVDPLPSEP